MKIDSAGHYKISLIIQDSISGKAVDVAAVPGIVEAVFFETELMTGAPGRLEVTMKEDPAGNLTEINHASAVIFAVDGEIIFTGYLWGKIGVDSFGTYKIVAYDQMHQLDRQQSVVRENMSAGDFFMFLCTKYNVPRFAVIEGSNTVLQPYNFHNYTLYTMLEKTLIEANIADRRQYIIRDEAGVLVMRELGALTKNIIIGDESFATSYTYEVDLKDSFNVIQMARDNEEIGKRTLWIVKDSENIDQWGWRQKTIDVDQYKTDSEIYDLARLFLHNYNRPRRFLNITAIGINGIKAGDGLVVNINRIDTNHSMWIRRCKHIYTTNSHEMELEMEAGG